MKFGLTDRHWKLIETEVISPLRACGARVWVFGSRARGDQKKFSDIDILYETQSLPVKVLGKIRENIEESSLPIKVDIVSTQELADAYHEAVFEERIEV